MRRSDHVTHAARDLISRLLSVRPGSRLSAQQVMCHPWMEAGGQVSREIEESFALHAELEDHVAGSMGVIGGLFGSLIGGRVGNLGGAEGGAAGGAAGGAERLSCRHEAAPIGDRLEEELTGLERSPSQLVAPLGLAVRLVRGL